MERFTYDLPTPSKAVYPSSRKLTHKQPDEDSNVRRVYHLGPAFIYLAKKPDGINITEWDGDGDFFKIDYKGPINDTRWFITGKLDYNFTIPEATPPGQYLMRVEYFWPRMRNESQFYVNCAQVNILGSGGGAMVHAAKHAALR